MNNISNLHSYDNVESVQGALPIDELKSYINNKLSSAKYNADFLMSLGVNDTSLVLEIGGQW